MIVCDIKRERSRCSLISNSGVGIAEAAKKRRVAEEEQELDLDSLLTAPSDQKQPGKKDRKRRKKGDTESVPSANGYAVGQKRRRKPDGASFMDLVKSNNFQKWDCMAILAFGVSHDAAVTLIHSGISLLYLRITHWLSAATVLAREWTDHASIPQTRNRSWGSLLTRTRAARKRGRSPVPSELCQRTCSSAKNAEPHFKKKANGLFRWLHYYFLRACRFCSRWHSRLPYLLSKIKFMLFVCRCSLQRYWSNARKAMARHRCADQEGARNLDLRVANFLESWIADAYIYNSTLLSCLQKYTQLAKEDRERYKQETRGE